MTTGVVDTPRAAYSVLERRATIIVGGILLSLAAAACWFTVRHAEDMTGMVQGLAQVGGDATFDMAAPVFLAMWVTMMVAMMFPTIAPIVLLHRFVTHGAYCLGCCWALMAVLFAVGLMNLAWMAVLTVVFLAEKNWERGPLSRQARRHGVHRHRRGRHRAPRSALVAHQHRHDAFDGDVAPRHANRRGVTSPGREPPRGLSV